MHKLRACAIDAHAHTHTHTFSLGFFFSLSLSQACILLLLTVCIRRMHFYLPGNIMKQCLTSIYLWLYKNHCCYPADVKGVRAMYVATTLTLTLLRPAAEKTLACEHHRPPQTFSSCHWLSCKKKTPHKHKSTTDKHCKSLEWSEDWNATWRQNGVCRSELPGLSPE